MEKARFCPVCKKMIDSNLVDTCESAYKYVIENIKKKHPNWVENDGACPKCVDYYKKV